MWPFTNQNRLILKQNQQDFEQYLFCNSNVFWIRMRKDGLSEISDT